MTSRVPRESELPEPRGAHEPPPARTSVQLADRPTLWRGSRLMGVVQLVAALPPSSRVGVLLPAEGHPPLTNIDQRRSLGSHGRVVVQSELDSHAIPWPTRETLPRSGAPHTYDAETLGPVSMALPFSTPIVAHPDRELHVRGDDGGVLPTSSILLTELRLVEGLTDPFRTRAPAAAIHRTPVPGAPDRERLWYVVIEPEAEHHAR